VKLIPDTLAGRTIAIVLIGLGAFHLVSLWLYNSELVAEIGQVNERQLAERLVGIKRVVMEVPAKDRDRMAHSLSGGTLNVHWGRVSLAAQNSAHGDPRLRDLETRLRELFPELPSDGLRIAYGDEGADNGGGSSKHVIVVSARLPDDSWLNFAVGIFGGATSSWHSVLLSTTATALAVLAVSILAVRVTTSSLRTVTGAAQRLGRGTASVTIDERGPREVRQAGVAFNEMQRRIMRLMNDHSRTLAAVSHDLRTPLTRLRFHAESIADQNLRDSVVQDVSEMEALIDSALTFLRTEAESEELRQSDIASICTTICNELSDQGHEVTCQPGGAVMVRARRLMLKRAIGNLVANGLKYGCHVRVRVEDRPSRVAIVVDDDGPGIPVDRIEEMFEPFKRLDDSRSRETGGVGLGLTVARMIARGHGGDVHLYNRAEGGLRAELTLPKSARD
jgi:two-component system, OmpR family, sensor kinase